MSLRQLFYMMLLVISISIIAATESNADKRALVARPKAPTGELAKGELWLITIGIDTYLQWPRLKTAVNDAKAVKEVLLNRYFLKPSNVVEIYDEEATRKNILGAFRSMTKNSGMRIRC